MLQDLGELNMNYCPQQGPKRLKEYKYNSKVKLYWWRRFNFHIKKILKNPNNKVYKNGVFNWMGKYSKTRVKVLDAIISLWHWEKLLWKI